MSFLIARRLSASLALVWCSATYAAQPSLDPGRGLRVESDSGFRWGLGARVHIDSAQFDSDRTLFADNTDVRRARLEFDARVAEDWRVTADYDVAGVVEGWKNVYAQYRGFDEVRVTFGSQLVPFSMDELTGSNETKFLERALPNALSPGILTGLSFQTMGRHYTLTAGLFGDSLDQDQRREADGQSLALRVTTAPVRSEDVVVHLGLAAELRGVDNDLLRYRARPESYMTSKRLVDTGTIRAVSDLTTSGLELGVRAGRFLLRAERMQANVDRSAGEDLAFEGAYATLGVVLTGERVSYNRRNGTFGDVEPTHRWGAIELSARTSRIDLTDHEVLGGIERNRAIGINWYVGQRFRVMMERIDIAAEPNSAGIDEHPSILQMRLQATL